MDAGQKLDAIKYVREASNLGLAQAKEWIENYQFYDLHTPQMQYKPTSVYSTTDSSASQTNFTYTPSSEYGNQAEIAKLEKTYKTQMIFGFLTLVYWPIAVILFVCASKTKKKINALKEGKPAPKGGCYVATCVYGSYDCPEVWTLRRFRDDTLGSTWYGRLFIRIYYAVSPILVKLFGKTKWFKKMWKGKLDKMVEKLNGDGVENTPYQDKDWKK